MLISLFKLEDIGPALTHMACEEGIELEKEVIEKFEFSGAMTYSLVFQGTIDLSEIASELYGPFPFAFSDGFVQYAFSFIADDPSMKDKRMKKKTIGLLLCLVPELVSKIDDFRDEFEKMLVYKFHNVTLITQVDDDFLKDIIDEYQQIVTNLLNENQATILSDQLKQFVSKGLLKEKGTKNVVLAYNKEDNEKIRLAFANLLLSLPYIDVVFNEKEARITTSSFTLYFIQLSKIDPKSISEQHAVLFLLDIMKSDYSAIYNLLKEVQIPPKIGVILAQDKDLEAMSKKYGEFFIGLSDYIKDAAFFSSSYMTTQEFKTKLLEAIFWALIP